MKNYIILVMMIIGIISSSCKKEDENEDTNTGKTTAIITVYDNTNKTVSGQIVYAYDQSTWEAHGDKPLVADKKVTTSSDGKATIELDDINNLFAFDSQEIIHFSVHYTVNGTETTKNTSLTFTKGSTKSASLTMN